eukprot:SAG11_NODE_11255_length_773_cov_1.603858_2_plen_71_part_01
MPRASSAKSPYLVKTLELKPPADLTDQTLRALAMLELAPRLGEVFRHVVCARALSPGATIGASNPTALGRR